jgi:S-formylglutathione hydrolase FrmB
MSDATVLTELSRSKCFGGHLVRYSHTSHVAQCTMKFHVFFPPKALANEKCAVRVPLCAVLALLFLASRLYFVFNG